MQQSSELFFASSNSHKFEEAHRILLNLGLNIRSFKTTLEEIQSNSMCEIAKRKAIDAYSKKQKPIIIEDAKFVAIIAYYNGVDDVKLFESSIPGKISSIIEQGGWGYDPIFIPDGESKTYANMFDKDKFSHRSVALTKFSNWFLDKQKDNGQ